MKRIFTLSVITFLSSFLVFGQTETDRRALLNFAEAKQIESQLRKQEAERYAIQNDLPIRIETDEYLAEIMEIRNGKPQYYITTNLGGAITNRVDRVWPGGGYLGLSLTGSGQTAGLWDGGIPLLTHQEYSGRVTVGDGSSSVSFHPTHIAGTIIGSGVDPLAKGMAYQGEIDSYDWNSDVAEMAAAAANGMIISNHSYGFIRGWHYDNNSSLWSWYGDDSIDLYEDFLFGFYDDNARQWDSVAYMAPKYLIVTAASNDRNDYNGSGPYEPDGGFDGYDCIAQQGAAKNVLTVGATEEVLDYANGNSPVMTDFSGWGPTDDGRIKPDIVSKGYWVFSAFNTNNTSYAILDGTSFSSSMTTGSLMLLHEYYMQSHGGDTMNSATLKGLAIHTADEAGPAPGPDYMFGWGLLNIEEAAALIKEDSAFQNVMDEQVLTNGGSYTRTVYASGNEPLKVTICWTDPPGTPVADQVDPDDPMLVHDLDLRVENAARTVFYPWKMDKENPTYAATNNGENDVDNVEQVFIANPVAGNYTITVDHDGTLQASQAFSIIISGIDEYTATPGCATLLSPSNGATGVALTTYIEWETVEEATAYDLYFGTDNPPTNIENGTTLTSTSYSPALSNSTTYYVKVVPKNNQGTATGCTVWNFTTGSYTKVSTFPFTENFDGFTAIGTGNSWSDGTDDDFNWTVLSGSTPSSETGPTQDHTTGSGKYLYTEATGNNPRKRADLYTPLFDMSGMTFPILEFWYNMYGIQMGHLYVDIYTGGGWQNEIWHLAYQQSSSGTDWKKATIDLTPYLNSNTQQIRFRGITGLDYRSDMALDDFSIQESSSMSLTGITTVQGPVTNVDPYSINQQIISVQITTSGSANALEVTSFTFDTKGTVDPTDIGNARLFYTGTSGTFATENQVGNKFSPPVGEFTIDFVNLAVLEEGTNYFWLVYDIFPVANSCYFLDAECLSVTIGGTPMVPSVTDPAGSRRVQGVQLVWADDFETDKGWTFGGEFERGIPQGLGSSLSGYYPDPSSAFDGTRVIGSDLTGLGSRLGNYEANTANKADFATSPVINCSGLSNVFIQFAMYLNVESPSYDHAYLEAWDGSAWNTVWENDAGYAFDEWLLVAFDVSAWADDNADFAVKFSIGPTDNIVHLSGWNVDAFQVYADVDCSGGIPGLWTAGAGTPDWSTGANWDDGNVPTGAVGVVVGRMDYDPALDEVSACNDLDIKDAGAVALGTGTNLTINGDLYNGHGLGGSFTLNDGNVTVTGNYYSEIGSSTTFSGGTFNFTNWYRNPSSAFSKGNVILSGGTLNASGSVIWSAFDLTGTMDGPVNLNIGETFRMNHDRWPTVSNGTVTLTGSASDTVYCFASVFGTGLLKLHNLVINAPSTVVILNPETDQTGMQILNNLTVTNGNVFTTFSGFTNNFFDVDGNFNIGASGNFQHGAFSSTVGGTLDVDAGGNLEIDDGGGCTVGN